MNEFTPSRRLHEDNILDPALLESASIDAPLAQDSVVSFNASNDPRRVVGVERTGQIVSLLLDASSPTDALNAKVDSPWAQSILDSRKEDSVRHVHSLPGLVAETDTGPKRREIILPSTERFKLLRAGTTREELQDGLASILANSGYVERSTAVLLDAFGEQLDSGVTIGLPVDYIRDPIRDRNLGGYEARIQGPNGCYVVRSRGVRERSNTAEDLARNLSEANDRAEAMEIALGHPAEQCDFKVSDEDGQPVDMVVSGVPILGIFEGQYPNPPHRGISPRWYSFLFAKEVSDQQ